MVKDVLLIVRLINIIGAKRLYADKLINPEDIDKAKVIGIGLLPFINEIWL